MSTRALPHIPSHAQPLRSSVWFTVWIVVQSLYDPSVHTPHQEGPRDLLVTLTLTEATLADRASRTSAVTALVRAIREHVRKSASPTLAGSATDFRRDIVRRRVRLTFAHTTFATGAFLRLWAAVRRGCASSCESLPDNRRPSRTDPDHLQSHFPSVANQEAYEHARPFLFLDIVHDLLPRTPVTMRAPHEPVRPRTGAFPHRFLELTHDVPHVADAYTLRLPEGAFCYTFREAVDLWTSRPRWKGAVVRTVRGICFRVDTRDDRQLRQTVLAAFRESPLGHPVLVERRVCEGSVGWSLGRGRCSGRGESQLYRWTYARQSGGGMEAARRDTVRTTRRLPLAHAWRPLHGVGQAYASNASPDDARPWHDLLVDLVHRHPAVCGERGVFHVYCEGRVGWVVELA